VFRKRIIIFITICLGCIPLQADGGDSSITMETLLREYEDADTYIEKANVLRRLVVKATFIDSELAKFYIKEFKDLSILSQDPAIEARYINAQAVLAYVSHAPADTIHNLLNKSLEVLRDHQVVDIEFEITIINNKAITYESNNENRLAIKEYTNGLDILSKQKVRKHDLETLFYSNIAYMMESVKRYDKALEYIQKAEEADEIEFAKNGKTSDYFEYIPYVKAKILFGLGRLNEAEKTLESMLAIDNQVNLNNNYGKILLGEIYINNKKSELGSSLLMEGLEEAKKLDVDIYNQIEASLNLAKLDLSQDNLTSALTHTDYILSLLKKHNQEIDDSEIPKVIASILERRGRYKESLEHNKSYQKLKEKELATQNDLIFDDFQKKFSETEKQYEINELEIKQKLQESKMSMLIVGFLLSLLLLFFIYFLYARKEEHNKSLLLKNKEVTTAKDKALRAAKAKENFLSTMSHELRTPMNAIIGITNILLDENKCDNQKIHLNNLKFSSKGLLNVINEVLDFSKIEAAKLQIIKKEFNLQENLDCLINSLRYGSANNNLKVIQDQQLAGLKHMVFGDNKRVNQILTNLLGNAIKFTSEGCIVLRTKIKENTDNRVHIVFEVEDPGIGIPSDKLESIFESFSQVNNEINRIHQGTGLGLGISKRLVELQGGKLSVSSTVGKGSTFSFNIEFEKRGLMLDIPASQRSATIYKAGLEGKKVLLVEDNKLNQLVALKVLKKFKIETALAENGQEAVEMVSKNNYDLVLMDIHMPIMDGIEATKNIRALEDPRLNNIPIIALSADAYSDKVIAARESGMNDYLSKPFKPTELFEKIKKNLSVNRKLPS